MLPVQMEKDLENSELILKLRGQRIRNELMEIFYEYEDEEVYIQGVLSSLDGILSLVIVAIASPTDELWPQMALPLHKPHENLMPVFCWGRGKNELIWRDGDWRGYLQNKAN